MQLRKRNHFKLNTAYMVSGWYQFILSPDSRLPAIINRELKEHFSVIKGVELWHNRNIHLALVKPCR